MTRAMSSIVIPVDSEAIVLPAIKTSIMIISNDFRDMADVSDVSTGAPNMTPRAYMVTVRPAEVTVM
ncbi:hypothetical protein D3C74_473490 [compost metagenome]